MTLLISILTIVANAIFTFYLVLGEKYEKREEFDKVKKGISQFFSRGIALFNKEEQVEFMLKKPYVAPFKEVEPSLDLPTNVDFGKIYSKEESTYRMEIALTNKSININNRLNKLERDRLFELKWKKNLKKFGLILFVFNSFCFAMINKDYKPNNTKYDNKSKTESIEPKNLRGN